MSPADTGFQIISHACLRLFSGPTEILFDPWLVGSCYWRSWWNFPEPDARLVDSLVPTHIVLTHIHWDHFHGPSLRRFSRETPILIPRDHYTRMADDLRKMGYHNVIEIPHGGHVTLPGNVRVYSYHFSPFTDSVVVVETPDGTFINASDAKVIGLPLQQIVRRHPQPDFVFRSHSSANDRACYEIVDSNHYATDDPASYEHSFISFAAALRPRYAVPFASNHCHLHDETWSYNDLIRTPLDVARAYAESPLKKNGPELAIMVSGDQWSVHGGFQIQSKSAFEDRTQKLERYREQQAGKLAATARAEAAVSPEPELLQSALGRFMAAVPLLLRLPFRGHPVGLVLIRPDGSIALQAIMDLWRKETLIGAEATQLDHQIHVSLAVFQQALRRKLLGHLGISKRVRYRLRVRAARRMRLLTFLFELYDYDWIPLRRLVTWRRLDSYRRRWREVLLYLKILLLLASGVRIYELESHELRRKQ